MTNLKGKIDFALIISVTNANPNGDPLNGNRPRENFDGYGEISDVCIKRKIRNRFQDMGERVFVQSDDRSDDSFTSLKDRAEGCAELKAEMDKKKKANRDRFSEIACRQWIDVVTARMECGSRLSVYSIRMVLGCCRMTDGWFPISWFKHCRTRIDVYKRQA